MAGLRDGRGALTCLSAEPEPAKPTRQMSAAQAERWDDLGTLTKAAITIGAAPEFWAWAGVTNARDAGEWIKRICVVASRKEFDADPEKARLFRRLVLEPYQRHSQTSQASQARG